MDLVKQHHNESAFGRIRKSCVKRWIETGLLSIGSEILIVTHSGNRLFNSIRPYYIDVSLLYIGKFYITTMCMVES